MTRKFCHLLVTTSLFFVVAGCMKVGPDYNRPDTGIEIPGAYQHATAEGVAPYSEDQWWKVFGKPEIDQLVEEVLKNNLDIKRATAGILEIRSQFVQTRADRFPTAGIEGQRKRQRQTAAVTSTKPGEWRRTETDTYSMSLPASFELDLWGRLARAEEAARADLLSAEDSRRIVAQTVVAETISLYLEVESLERQIQIVEQSIRNYARSLALVEYRYERGLTSILDVKQGRRTLARAEAFLPPLRQKLGITQQKMAVVLGRYPETSPPRPQQEDYFKSLDPVPPGLPSDLLMRRPDVRAAEAKLKALNALVGVAKASRFPSITLTGSLGYSSDQLDELFRPKSELWSMSLGIVQPLFNAGKLRAGQRAAEARYQQGLIEYAKAVLTAFSEVEKSLLTRKEQLERRERTMDFLREARATQEVAENRYKRGLVDYQTVLETQQTRFQAEESLVLVELAILTNRVTLHRALGGGWAEPEKQ